MQVHWRRLAPGELDHECVWLTVSLAGIAGAAIWLSSGWPWPQCAFLRLTSHPCVTCGATRSGLQFVHAHFGEALRWNPLAFAAFVGLTVFDIYAFIVLVLRLPRLRMGGWTPAEKVTLRLAVITLLGLNWLYLLNSGLF